MLCVSGHGGKLAKRLGENPEGRVTGGLENVGQMAAETESGSVRMGIVLLVYLWKKLQNPEGISIARDEGAAWGRLPAGRVCHPGWKEIHQHLMVSPLHRDHLGFPGL